MAQQQQRQRGRASIVGIGCRLPGPVNSPAELMEFLVGKECALARPPADRYGMLSTPPAAEGSCAAAAAGGKRKPAKDEKSMAEQLDRLGMGCLSASDAASAFDNRFFHLSPLEADAMDPQQKMALEVTYQALQDAGLSMEAVRGRNIGVFVGAGLPENSIEMSRAGKDFGRFRITGTYLCYIANRISYFFSFTGPSLTLDTACSSSLTALHLAVDSLNSGECEAAVVLGTNALVSSWILQGFFDTKVLSPTATSAPFDARGDGFCRAEGAVAMVLLPSSGGPGAKVVGRHGWNLPAFRTYAHVVGSGIGADGHKPNMSAPLPEGQARVIRAVHSKCGVPVEDVCYVEAHATGTPTGDPVEAKTLGKTFRPDASTSTAPSPLAVGSIKGNLGHLEAAAGITGLVKAALMLHHRTLLPTPRFSKWRSTIDPKELRLRVVTDVEPLSSEGALYMGVNSFGIGGANAYALLAAADASAACAPGSQPLRLPLVPRPLDTHPATPPPAITILPLAASNSDALTTYRCAWRAFAQRVSGVCGGSPAAVAAVLDMAVRAHLTAAVFTPPGRQVLLGQLPDMLVGEGGGEGSDTALQACVLQAALQRGPSPPAVCVVFGGQGAFCPDMGDDHWRHLPAFQSALSSFAECYAQVSGTRLLGGPATTGGIPWSAATARELSGQSHNDVRAVLAAIIAVQYAQWRVLEASGMAIAAVTGYSAGEMTAALAAGAIGLQELCALTHARATALAAMPRGAMAAARCSAEVALRTAAACGLGEGDVSVAAFAAAEDVTLSGAPEAMAQLLAALRQAGVAVAPVPVEHAFHSCHVTGVLPLFEATLQRVMAGWPAGSSSAEAAGADAPRLVSTTTGAAVKDVAEVRSAAHWLSNLQQPVQFQAAMGQLLLQGGGGVRPCNAVVLVGAKAGGLKRYVRSNIAASIAAMPAPPQQPPLLRALHNGPAAALHDALEALAQLWLGGATVQWDRLSPAAPVGMPFPMIPWHRTAKTAPLARASAVTTAAAAAGAAAAIALQPATARPRPAQRTTEEVAEEVQQQPLAPLAQAGVAAAPAPAAAPAITAPEDLVLQLPEHYADHFVMGRALVPVAAYMCFALQYAAAKASPGSAVTVSELQVRRPLPCGAAPGAVTQLQLRARPTAGATELRFGTGTGAPGAVCALGAFVPAEVEGDVRVLSKVLGDALGKSQNGCSEKFQELSPRFFYRYLQQHTQFHYRRAFQGIDKLWVGDGAAAAQLRLPKAASDAAAAGTGMLQAALVDAALQTLLAAVPMPTKDHFGLPVGAARVVAWPGAAGAAALEAARGGGLQAAAVVTRLSELGAGDATGSVMITTETGEPVLLVQDLAIRAAPIPASAGSAHEMAATHWVPVPSRPDAAIAGSAGILTSAGTGVMWVGPSSVVAQLRPVSRAATDAVVATDRVPAAQLLAHVQSAMAAAGGSVAAIVCAGATVSDAVALLGGTPASVALLLLRLGEPTAGASGGADSEEEETLRVVGYVKAARQEQRGRQVHSLVVRSHGGAHGAAALSAASAACLQLLSHAHEGEGLLVLPEGALYVPRLLPLALPQFVAAPSAPAPAAAAKAPVTAAAVEPQPPLTAEQLRSMAAPRWCATVEKPGQLSTVAFRRLEAPREPQPNEVLIEVSAVSLHFKDVMLAMGLLPGLDISLGQEVSGHIVACGSAVTTERGLRPGARVVAVPLSEPGGAQTHAKPPAIASHIMATASAVVVVPDHIPLVESAGHIVVHATALYALRHRAKLAKGEVVVIHSAMGGVGQAALRVAQGAGARIIASAGTEAKRERLLAEKGVIAVLDSRNPATFKPGVDAATGGGGVDVVLNSLAGEGQDQSIRLLAPHGRFVEIGKQELLNDTPIRLGKLLHNGTFISAHIDMLCEDRPDAFMELIAESAVDLWGTPGAPLPEVNVRPVVQLERALREMSRGRHTGKLVLQVPQGWSPTIPDGKPIIKVDIPPAAPAKAAKPTQAPPAPLPRAAPAASQQPAAKPSLSISGTVLLTGGTAGTGLALVAKLAHGGMARHFLLLSSRTEDALLRTSRLALAGLRNAGATITVCRCDITDAAAVSAAIASAAAAGAPAVEAVAHFATHYEFDGAAAPLPRTHPVFTVKAGGAWALHAATCGMPTVKHFLVVSSVARVFGWEGSASYSMANQSLAGVVAARRANGLPAMLLDLFPVSGAGRLARWAHVAEVMLVLGTLETPIWHIGSLTESVVQLLAHAEQGTLASCVAKPCPRKIMAWAKGSVLRHYVDAATSLAPAASVSHAQLLRKLHGDTTMLNGTSHQRATVVAAPTAATASVQGHRQVPSQAQRAAAAAAPAAAAAAPGAARAEVVDKLCVLLGCDESEVPDHQPLAELGLDSLAAVELSNWIQDEFGYTGGADTMQEGLQRLAGMSLAQLVAELSQHTSQGAQPTPVPAPVPVTATPAAPSQSLPPVAQPAPVQPAAAVSNAGYTVPATSGAAASGVSPQAAVVDKLCVLLGCDESEVPEHQPLAELGLDSLAAVELSNWIQDEFGYTGGAETMQEGLQRLAGMSLAQLVAELSQSCGQQQLQHATPAPAAVAPAPAAAPQPTADYGFALPAGASVNIGAVAAVQPAVTTAVPDSATNGLAAVSAGATRAAVVDKLCVLLGCDESEVPEHQPLAELGLDSLAAVELSNWIQDEFGYTGGAETMQEGLQRLAGMSLAQLVDELSTSHVPQAPAAAFASAATAATTVVATAAAPSYAAQPAPAAVATPPAAEFRFAAPASVSHSVETYRAQPAASPAVPDMATNGTAVTAGATRAAVVDKLCVLLGCDESEVPEHQPLAELGLDSLAAVELSNWIQDEFGYTGGADTMQEGLLRLAGMSLAQLVAELAQSRGQEQQYAPVPVATAPAPVAAATAPVAVAVTAVTPVNAALPMAQPAITSAAAPAAAGMSTAAVHAAVVDKLCVLLGCDESEVPEHQPLAELGLDSLAAVELSNWIQDEFGYTGGADTMQEGLQRLAGMSLAQLVAELTQHTSQGAPPSASAAAAPVATPTPAPHHFPAQPPVTAGSAHGAAAITSAATEGATRAAVVEKLCVLLGCDESEIPEHQPLVELGLDSLAGVELSNWVRDEFGSEGTVTFGGDVYWDAQPAQGLQQLAGMTLNLLVDSLSHTTPTTTLHHPHTDAPALHGDMRAAVPHLDPVWEGAPFGGAAADVLAPPAVEAPVRQHIPAVGAASATASAAGLPPMLPRTSRCAGIHALEVYVPANAVTAAEVEAAGKFVRGKLERLGIEEMAHPGPNEDTASMAMTAVARLCERHGVSYSSIGRLEVGTESPLDLSKSIKSVIMQLFDSDPACGEQHDVEGADVVNACYGGTSALLNTLNWVESEAWDGRWGVVVAVDIASFRMGGSFFGAAAVAMLVGADAPVVFDSVRSSHSQDSYDFWKPLGAGNSANATERGPEVCPYVQFDGKCSLDAYITAQGHCHAGLCRKLGWDHVLLQADYVVQHTTHAYWAEKAFQAMCETLPGAPLPQERIDSLFERTAAPAQAVGRRVGPCYTASTWLNLASLLSVQGPEVLGRTLVLFSYGSGLCSTMLRATVRELPRLSDAFQALEGRRLLAWTDFSALVCAHNAEKMRLGDFTDDQQQPGAGGVLLPGTYYVTGIDRRGRRSYSRTPLQQPLRVAGLPPLDSILRTVPRPQVEAPLPPVARHSSGAMSPVPGGAFDSATVSTASMSGFNASSTSVSPAATAATPATPLSSTGSASGRSGMTVRRQSRGGGSGGGGSTVTTMELHQPSLDGPMLRTLISAFEEARDSIVVVRSVVQGVFNLGWHSAPPLASGGVGYGADSDAAADASDGLQEYAALLRLLQQRTQPLVCVVQGQARGGGLMLPAVADIVLATPDATFGLPEIRRGLLPSIVSAALTARLTPVAVRRLSITGTAIDASEALRIGLVDTLLAGGAEAAEAELARLCRRLAATPHDLMAAAKRRLPAASADDGVVLVGELLNGGWAGTASGAHGSDNGIAEAVVLSFPSEGVAVLELNMAAKGNAMDDKWTAALDAALDRLDPHLPHLSAVVVHGAGKHFCTGMSLAHVRRTRGAAATAAPATAARMAALSRAVMRLSRLPVPVLSVVHGAVLGGGCALALHADWRIAGGECSISYGNLSRGTSPLFNLPQKLVATVGYPAAMHIYLSDAVLNADQALTAGLVHETAPTKEAALARALALAAAIATHPRAGIHHTMRLYREADLGGDAAAVSAEALAITACIANGAFTPPRLQVAQHAPAETPTHAASAAAAGHGGSITAAATAVLDSRAAAVRGAAGVAGRLAAIIKQPRRWDGRAWLRDSLPTLKVAESARLELAMSNGINGRAIQELVQLFGTPEDGAGNDADSVGGHDVFGRAGVLGVLARAVCTVGASGYFPVITSSDAASRVCTMQLMDGSEPQNVINAGSMDYCGLAQHPDVVGAMVESAQTHGSTLTNSRVLCGSSSLHRQLEQELADYFGREACLVLPAGWLAGVAAVKALMRHGDVIFIDAYAHDCLATGAKLADARAIKFTDDDNLVAQLQMHRHKYAGAIIVTEHTFSVDGARRDVSRYAELARAHECRLVVDIAHSVGSYSNLPEAVSGADILIGTFSKGLVSQGGFIVGTAKAVQLLSVTGMPFTANLAAPAAAAAMAALRVLRREPWRAEMLETLVARARSSLRARGCDVAETGGPLLHVVCGQGTEPEAWALWRYAWEHSVYVHPALFPMSPLGRGGVRFTLCATLTPETVDYVVGVLADGVAFVNAAGLHQG